MPLGATLAAATEGFREVLLAATRAVVLAAFPVLHAEAASQAVALPELHTEAALLEAASRVAADMVVDGIKRQPGWVVDGLWLIDSVFALEPFARLRRIVGIITPGGIGLELYLQLHSRPIIDPFLGWFHHQIAPLWPVKN